MATESKTATSEVFSLKIGNETLYGITKTEYIKDGNNAKPSSTNGSSLKYYTEVDQATYDKLPPDQRIKSGSGVTEKPYALQATLESNGEKASFVPSPQAGESLKRAIADYNSGKQSPIKQVLYNGTQSVARDLVSGTGRNINTVNSGLAQKLFTPKNTSANITPPTPSSTRLDKFELTENLKAKEGTRTEFPKNLKYPIDISDQQDKLKIDMVEFKTREFNLKTLTFNDRDQTIQTTKGTVILAIPGNVSDNNRVNWGSQDMNAGDAAVAMAALNIIKNGGPAIEALTKSLESLATDPNVSRDVKTGFAAFFAGNAAGVQGLLARTAGAVINPNTELLFQGPALRAFTFSFKLSPRSEAEAKMVRSIIRFFKQGMAVQRTQSELFLKAPMIYKLSFRSGTTEHTFLPKTKLCALLDCSINYTPEGTYATFKDSSMVSYDMSLTFNELDPVFNDDYSELDKNADTQIGY